MLMSRHGIVTDIIQSTAIGETEEDSDMRKQSHQLYRPTTDQKWSSPQRIEDFCGVSRLEIPWSKAHLFRVL